MEYNTQREKLILPVYGRNVQMMIDYVMSLPDREERLHCAEKIIEVMGRMYPKKNRPAELTQTLWDHLAYMSDYKLDIDWPYPITRVKEEEKPEKIPYPMNNIKLRHYGHLVEKLIDEVKNMEEGARRDAVLGLLANQMRKDLFYSNSNKNALNNKRIADDLYRLSDGKINIDDTQIKYNQSIPTGNNINNTKGRRSKRSK